MSGAEEEVGEIKSLEKFIGETLKDVGDINGGEVMSGTRRLISLKTPGQESTEGRTSNVNVEEPWLEVGGGDQSSWDMEGLR